MTGIFDVEVVNCREAVSKKNGKAYTEILAMQSSERGVTIQKVFGKRKVDIGKQKLLLDVWGNEKGISYFLV